MKRKFSKYTRKTMSVFMAVLMVLSVFVFVPEMFTKAEAATAGKYYVRVTWKLSNKGSSLSTHYTGYGSFNQNSDSNNQFGFSLFYKDKNGTGTQYEVYWDIGNKSPTSGSTNSSDSVTSSNGYIDSSTGNYTCTAIIQGFPTYMFVCGDYNSLATKCIYSVTKIEIGKSTSYGTTLWSGSAYINSTNQQKYTYIRSTYTAGSTNNGNDSSNAYTKTDAIDWTMPYANSITGLSAQTLTIDKTSGSVTSGVLTGVVKDQYGVNWYQAPTYSVLNESGTSVSNPSRTTSGDGVTLTATTACLTSANSYNTTTGQAKFTLKATRGSATQSVTITVKSPTYYVYFYDGDGNQISTKSCYYNGSVTAPTTANKSPDADYHYTFNGTWDKGYTGIKSDTVINANFDSIAHSFEEVTTPPTCTTVGEKKYTCSVCGYSYTEEITKDPNAHSSLVTDSAVPATTDRVGLTQGEHCSACGEVTKAQEITPTVAKTKVYEGSITNNIKGSYTYLGVTKTEPEAMVSQTQPDCETTLTGSYGTINIENGEAVYTVTTMQFSGTETFYLLAKAENIDSNNGALSAYFFEKVTIVPAKTLYYEDNFSSADGITYTDGVCSDGSSKYGVWNINKAPSVNDAADEAADLAYNSDYKNYATLSGSSAHTVSVSELNKGNSNKNWPSATFTFAGTGFDVISLTDSDSGVFYVTVYKGTDTAGELVKTVMMDTYYGYTYSPLYFSTVTRKIVGSPEDGVTELLYPSKITDKKDIPENDKEYIVTSNGAIYTTNTAKASSTEQAYGWVKTGNAQTLYQVPVIHIDGLDYGTYTAKIEARFTGLFGHYNTDETGIKYYDLCIDAIRINNPFNTSKADEAYEQSGQSRVNYTDIKSSLSSAEKANTANATGLILLDGGKTVSQGSLEDYKEVLPKNEIYLSGGQSVAFDIDTADYEDVLIGMRSANAAPLTVQVIYGSKSADIAINSGTELYYSILTALGEDSLSGTVVIKNTTDGAVLSMTKMKTVAKENSVSEAAMPMTLSMFTAPRAMALLAMAESDLSIDEESVETATEEGKITLSVTTGSDVSSLIIRDENGNELTPDEVNSVVSGDEIKWTVTLTETESGRYTYSLEGAYENGYTKGDTVEITVDVEITEPVPEEPEIPSDETEDSGKTDSFVELFDFLVSLLRKLLSRIFGVELV
ncbi:MAG: hypothetical protein ACI4VI_09060 [Acutalibacteraceae bacterium]